MRGRCSDEDEGKSAGVRVCRQGLWSRQDLSKDERDSWSIRNKTVTRTTEPERDANILTLKANPSPDGNTQRIAHSEPTAR